MNCYVFTLLRKFKEVFLFLLTNILIQIPSIEIAILMRVWIKLCLYGQEACIEKKKSKLNVAVDM